MRAKPCDRTAIKRLAHQRRLPVPEEDAIPARVERRTLSFRVGRWPFYEARPSSSQTGHTAIRVQGKGRVLANPEPPGFATGRPLTGRRPAASTSFQLRNPPVWKRDSQRYPVARQHDKD